MPKGLLQEKFQRTLPDPQTDGSNDWTRVKRKVAPQDYMQVSSSRPGAGSAVDFESPVTNRMPPGMFVDNQPQADIRRMSNAHSNLAGSSDESNSVNAAMLHKGYQRQNMLGTDDLYNNEHTEEFYGEATVEGKTGFLERNNYLDRN